ncbi:MAG: hypothetical protein KGR26_12545 [Cyanobacteria bacterium REEB65]|nr:hypothetical protein [Cyanobacteria bacterium REEB65]
MGILHEVINDGGIELSGNIGDAELEALLELATGRCSDEADARTLYLADAIEAIDRYQDFEPSKEECCDHLRSEDLGDWRRAVTVAGYLTVRDYLGHQVAKDTDALKMAVVEAAERGFVAVALHADCQWGWAPHARETDWQTGVVFEWKRLAADVSVIALAVKVSGGDRLWLQLERAQ